MHGVGPRMSTDSARCPFISEVHSLWWDMSDIPSGADTRMRDARPAAPVKAGRQAASNEVALTGAEVDARVLIEARSMDDGHSPTRQRSFFDGGWLCQGHGQQIRSFFEMGANVPHRSRLVERRLLRLIFTRTLFYAATIATRMGRDPHFFFAGLGRAADSPARSSVTRPTGRGPPEFIASLKANSPHS